VIATQFKACKTLTSLFIMNGKERQKKCLVFEQVIRSETLLLQ